MKNNTVSFIIIIDPVIICQSLVKVGVSWKAAHSIPTDQSLNSLEEIGLLTDW
jgi:hypothetical protein